MSHHNAISRVVALGALMIAQTSMNTAVAVAADVQWRSDLRQAAMDAEKSGKPMLLKFTADWCGYCRKMESTTFRDDRIVQQVNGCFIPISVNADRNQRLKAALQIDGLPTTVIISPKFEVMKKIVGYQSAKELGTQLDGFCPKSTVQDSSSQQRPRMRVVAETKPAKIHIEPEPAFDGYCVVSMLSDRKFRKGDPAISLVYRGQKIIFASTAKREAFKADPRKYWPYNAGLCAVTLRETGRNVAGRPQFAAIYRDQLWFFKDAEQRKKFAANPAKFATASTAERR